MKSISQRVIEFPSQRGRLVVLHCESEDHRLVSIQGDPEGLRSLGELLTAGYFRIGSDGGELSFFVSPGRSSQGVWYLDIETGEFRKYCDTLRDYVDKCRRIDADDEGLPNEGSHLPEWMKYGYTILILAGFVLFGYAAYRVATWVLGATGLR